MSDSLALTFDLYPDGGNGPLANYLRLVDFSIGQVDYIHHLPDGQVMLLDFCLSADEGGY